MPITKTEIREAYRNWLCRIEPQLCFTGSVRQCLKPTAFSRNPRYATIEDIARNVEQVIERCSRAILGRSAVRKGRKLSYVAAVEGQERPLKDGGSRLHAHIAIAGIPATFSLTEAKAILEDKWRNSRWGYVVNETIIADEDEPATGYVPYLLKTLNPDNTERFFTNLSGKDAFDDK